jgi:hypothetical protein
MKYYILIFISIIPFLLGILSHLTCLYADFTYDDHPAVVEHPVSRLAQPLRRALFTDYWGLDIASFHSHGSFRPVTTASFALSSLISRFIQSINLYKETTITNEHIGKAFEYRLVSLILHGMSSSIVFILYKRFSGSILTSLFCASIFAIHPILTEAICSIACRADVLAGFFSLLVVYFIDIYLHIRKETIQKVCTLTILVRSSLLFLSLTFGILATFSKETGIMSLIVATGLCLSVGISHLLYKDEKEDDDNKEDDNDKEVHVWKGGKVEIIIRAFIGAFLLFITAIFLFLFRIWIQGDRLPEFYAVDNISVGLQGFSKLLTLLYLSARHLGLMFIPYPQSHDWSFLVIDPILNVNDKRNISTIIIFGLSLVIIIINLVSYIKRIAKIKTLEKRFYDCFTRHDNSSLGTRSKRFISFKEQVILPVSMAVCFSIGALFISFLPASSFLFTTGFTIAERVLYIPTVFLGLTFSILLSSSKIASLYPKIILVCAITLCILFLLLSLRRSLDWTNDESLWASTLIPTPNHPKALYTLANRLQTFAGKGEDGYLPVLKRILGNKQSTRLFNGLNTSLYSSPKEIDYQAALILYNLCIAAFRDRTGKSNLGVDTITSHPRLSSWDRIFPDPNVNIVHILMDLLEKPKTREELSYRQNTSAFILRQMLQDLYEDDTIIYTNKTTRLIQQDDINSKNNFMDVSYLRKLYNSSPKGNRMSLLLSTLQNTCSSAPYGSERNRHKLVNINISCALSRSGMKIDKSFARVHERVLTVGLSALNAAVFTGDVHGIRIGLEPGGKYLYVDDTIAELLLRSSAILSLSNPSLGPTNAMLTLGEAFKMRGAFGLSVLWFDRSARWTVIQAETRAKEGVALRHERYETFKKVPVSKEILSEKVNESNEYEQDYKLSKSYRKLVRLADKLSMKWEWIWPEADAEVDIEPVYRINQTSLLSLFAQERLTSNVILTKNSTTFDDIEKKQQSLRSLQSLVKIRTIDTTGDGSTSTGGRFCSTVSSSLFSTSLDTTRSTKILKNTIFNDFSNTKDGKYRYLCKTPYTVSEPCGRILAATSRAASSAVTAFEQAFTRGSLISGKVCTCKRKESLESIESISNTTTEIYHHICVLAQSALPWSLQTLGHTSAVPSHRVVQHFKNHSCPNPCIYWFNEDSSEEEEEEKEKNGKHLGLGMFAPLATDSVTFPLAFRLARRAVILGKSWVVNENVDKGSKETSDEFEEPYKRLLTLCGC